MELSFVVEAVRRYAWLIVLSTIVCALPGFVIQQSADPLFQSSAVLIVNPARDARVQINVTGANERYVLGQLAVLRSDGLASSVAERIGDDDLESSIQFRHDNETDIVEIVASSTSPERAQVVADAYADEYLEFLATQLDPQGSPRIAELDEQLAVLGERIAEVDAQIAVAMEPFLAAATVPSSDLRALPTIEQVAPGLVSERQLLTADYLGRLAARTDLALGSQLSVATEVVERATEPVAPISQRRSLLIVAGALGGTLIGLFLAALVARLTPLLLSPRHASEILGGQTVLGPMRWRHRKEDGLLGVDIELDGAQRDVLSTLRSTLMITPGSGRAMMLLVSGTSPSAKSAHVASSIASLWATEGYRTVLVDADLRRTALTSTINTDTRPAVDGARGLPIADGLVDTVVPDLLLLPAGSDGTAARRERIDLLAHEIGSTADVVVFDVGFLLESTLALDVARSMDGVVLAIGGSTRASALALVGRQLSGQTDRLAAVWTAPSPLWRKQSTRQSPPLTGTRSEPTNSSVEERTESRIGHA